MKNSKNLIILATLGSLTMAACAPRDAAVTTDAERAFIQSRKGRSDTTGTASTNGKPTGVIEKTDYRVSDAAFATVLLEKHAEILDVLASSQADRFEAKGSYYIEAKATSSALDKVLLVAKNKTTNLSGGAEALKSNLNADWKLDLFKEEVDGAAKVVFVEGVNKETRIAVDRQQRVDNAVKLFANLNLQDGELKAYPLKGTENFKVFYSATGLLNAAKDKMSAWPVKIKIEMTVAISGLTAETMSVSNVYSSMVVGEAKPREIRLSLAKDAILTYKNSNCPLFEGTVQYEFPVYKAGGKPEFVKNPVVLTAEKIGQEGSSVNFVQRACNEKPTVDLSRLIQ